MTATVQIPNLPTIPAILPATAIFYVVVGGVSYRCTAAQIAAFVGGDFGNLSIVLDKTTDYAILASDNNKTFVNRGALGTVILTLPASSIGLQYNFIVAEAQNLIIDVGGSVIISLAEFPTTAGGNVSSNSPYSFLTLKCLSLAHWAAISMGGSWNAS